MCSLCTKYKRLLLLVPTFLERCFNLGPLPELRLSAALGLPVGGSFGGRGLLRPQSVMQPRRGPIPSSPSQQSGPPSAFTPPSSRLHGRTASRWGCLLLQVFSRRGDQPCALDLSPPPPTSSIVSKVGDRGKERLGPDGGNGIGVGGMKSRNVGSSIIHMKPDPPSWGPRGQGTPGPRQKTPFCCV